MYSIFLVTKVEVENLLTIFRDLVTSQKAKMDRTKFRTVLHNTFQMTDDILMDRSKYQWTEIMQLLY